MIRSLRGRRLMLTLLLAATMTVAFLALGAQPDESDRIPVLYGSLGG